MIRYIEFLTMAALNDFLAACWRRYYDQQYALWQAYQQYGFPVPEYGVEGVDYLSGQFKWATVRCPKVEVITDPGMPQQAICKLSGDPTNEPLPYQWAQGGPIAGIPSVAQVALAQTMGNNDYHDTPVAERARYLLGAQVGGQQADLNARMYSAAPALMVHRNDVSAPWDAVLDALENPGV